VRDPIEQRAVHAAAAAGRVSQRSPELLRRVHERDVHARYHLDDYPQYLYG